MAKASTKTPAKEPAKKEPNSKPAAAKKPAAAPSKKKTPAKAKPKPRTAIDWAAPDILAAYDRETGKLASTKETEIEELKKDWDRKKEAALTAKKSYEMARTELEELVKAREEGRGKPPTNTGSLFQAQEQAEAGKHLQKKVEELKKENAELAKRVVAEQENAARARKIVAEVAGATAMPADAGGRGVPAKAAEAADRWFPEDLWKRFPVSKMTVYGLSEKDAAILQSGDMKEGRSAFPMLTIGDVGRYTEPQANGFQRRLTDLKGFGPASLQRWEAAGEQFWAAWANGLETQFAQESGFKPHETAAPPLKIHEPDAAADLRGGGAKPQAPEKAKAKANKGRSKKGKADAAENGAERGTDGEGSQPSDVGSSGQPARPGVDADGFPTSYDESDFPGIPAAESEPDGDGEAE
jgi:hypothetical protein